MMINWACYALPGLIACLLGFFSAIQLLHQRSGNAGKAFLSISGFFYIGIRVALPVATFILAHTFLLPETETHPTFPDSFDFSMWTVLVELPVRHYVLGLLSGFGSEFLLRGMLHAYTVSTEDGAKREVMIGLQKIVQTLEDYTCTRAAIRDAHRKNRLIDRYVPHCTFPEFADRVRRRLRTYSAEAVQSKARDFQKKLNAHMRKYLVSQKKDDLFYNRVLASDILNTFDKRTLKDFTREINGRKKRRPAGEDA